MHSLYSRFFPPTFLYISTILLNVYIQFKQHAMIPLCMEPFLHKKLLIRKSAKWRKKQRIWDIGRAYPLFAGPLPKQDYINSSCEYQQCQNDTVSIIDQNLEDTNISQNKKLQGGISIKEGINPPMSISDTLPPLTLKIKQWWLIVPGGGEQRVPGPF